MEPNEFLQLMRESRDDYSDKIPPQILHNVMIVDGKLVTPKYKVRKNWFAYSFYAAVDLGISSGFVSEEAAGMMKDFYEYAKQTNLPGRLTTYEDINRANKVLTAIIQDLEIQQISD